MYNGRDEKKPIYVSALRQGSGGSRIGRKLTKADAVAVQIAILGDVYDVSEGRRIYGPGGYYSFFSGRDASRAYVTGCFKTHLTYDVRDFDDQQMSVSARRRSQAGRDQIKNDAADSGLYSVDLQGLMAWKDFYDKHAKYYKVGRVVLPPLDASVPVPEPCEDPSAQK